MQNTAEKPIVWGKHPSHGDCWLKLSEYRSKKDVEYRKKLGWQIAILPKGEKP